MFKLQILLLWTLTCSANNWFTEEEDIPASPIGQTMMQKAEIHRQTTVFDLDKESPHLMAVGFEGDIRHSRGLIRDIFLTQHASVSSAPEAESKIERWTGATVPYEVSQRFDSHARQIIADALTEIHLYTCIRFVPRTDEPDYLYINTGSRQGCLTDVGRQGGRQNLTLASDECFDSGAGVLIHLLMHVLGFLHEESRLDRDRYIAIQWRDIEPYYDRHFLRYAATQIDQKDTTYDYTSIMHAPTNHFASVDGYDTILPRDFNARIGQRQGLSTMDVYKLNLMYQCEGYSSEAPSLDQPMADRSSQCGGQAFDRTYRKCCNEQIFNPTSHICCDGQISRLEKSQTIRRRVGCCGGIAFFGDLECCAGTVYNLTLNRCCNHEVVPFDSECETGVRSGREINRWFAHNGALLNDIQRQTLNLAMRNPQTANSIYTEILLKDPAFHTEQSDFGGKSTNGSEDFIKKETSKQNDSSSESSESSEGPIFYYDDGYDDGQFYQGFPGVITVNELDEEELEKYHNYFYFDYYYYYFDYEGNENET